MPMRVRTAVVLSCLLCSRGAVLLRSPASGKPTDDSCGLGGTTALVEERPAWLTGEDFVDENGRPVVRQGCLQRKASLVMDHVPVGASVLEMAARYGVVTCAIARKVGPKGRVVSVEPDQRVWAALERNLKKFCPEVALFKGAVSGTPLYFKADKTNGLLSHTVSNNTADPSVVKIDTVRVEDLQRQHGLTFDTVWADCQGCFRGFVAEEKDALAQGTISHVVLEEDDSSSLGDDQYAFTEKQRKDYEPVELAMKNAGFSELHRSSNKKDGLMRVIFVKGGTNGTHEAGKRSA